MSWTLRGSQAALRTETVAPGAEAGALGAAADSS